MARYRLAHTLASLGDTDGALQQIEAAKRAAVRLPSRDRAYIAAADAYFRRDYAQAERQYRDLLEQHPYESEARVLLLYVLIDQGRNDEALAEAETLAEQDPGDEVAWSSVADLNLKLGHYDAADAALAKLIAITPDNPNAYYLLGESRLFRGEYDDAAVQYRKALQVDAGFGDAALRLADIEVLRNRPQSAVTQLEPLLAQVALAPSLRITAAFNLAALLRAQGRCADALAALDRVHATSPLKKCDWRSNSPRARAACSTSMTWYTHDSWRPMRCANRRAVRRAICTRAAWRKSRHATPRQPPRPSPPSVGWPRPTSMIAPNRKPPMSCRDCCACSRMTSPER